MIFHINTGSNEAPILFDRIAFLRECYDEYYYGYTEGADPTPSFNKNE